MKKKNNSLVCPLYLTLLALVLSGCGAGAIGGAAFFALSGGTSTTTIPGDDTTFPDLVLTPRRGSTTALIVTDPATGDESLDFPQTFQYTIVNAGNEEVAAPTVRHYLSSTKQLGSAFQFRTDAVANPATIGTFVNVESGSSEEDFIEHESGLETAISPGIYYHLIEVKASGDPNPDNNVAVFPNPVVVTQNPGAPTQGELDFRLANVVSPTQGIEGETIDVQFSVLNTDADEDLTAGENTGVEVTSSVSLKVRAFLSDDQVLTGSDQELTVAFPSNAEVDFPATQSGKLRRKRYSVSVELPTATTFGRRFLFVSIEDVTEDGTGTPTPLENADYDFNNSRMANTFLRLYPGPGTTSGPATLPKSHIALSPISDVGTTEAGDLNDNTQLILSFEIPDHPDVEPDSAQLLILLNSDQFDPILELLDVTGNSISVSDDRLDGQSAIIYRPVESVSSFRRFYLVVSSFSGRGGAFNVIVNLNSRKDTSTSAVVPLNLDSLPSLGTFPSPEPGTSVDFVFEQNLKKVEFLFFLPASAELLQTLTPIPEQNLDIFYSGFSDTSPFSVDQNAQEAVEPVPLTGTTEWNGTTTVEGTETLFQSELSVGDKISLESDGQLFEVASIASDTQLTIVDDPNLTIPSDSGDTNRIIQRFWLFPANGVPGVPLRLQAGYYRVAVEATNPIFAQEQLFTLGSRIQFDNRIAED